MAIIAMLQICVRFIFIFLGFPMNILIFIGSVVKLMDIFKELIAFSKLNKTLNY